MEQISHYKNIIQQKLFTLEKKFRLSAQYQQDSDKLTELYRHIKTLSEYSIKLEHNQLTWNELETIGISQQSIISQFNTTREITNNIEDNSYDLLNAIPLKELLTKNIYQQNFINHLYSIIEYININYQTIFTQKILLSASKTNSIREYLYMQYQDIIHIFKSYKMLGDVSTNSVENEKLLKKEYKQLLKSIFIFFNNIKHYIDLITKDTTFTKEDFAEVITSTDKTISIYGLPLSFALEECNLFIDEAINFIITTNKDFFDYLALHK